MQLEFVGDWSQSDAEAIASALRKSMGMDDSGLDDLTPAQITDFPKLLSARQKKLIELWRKAGKKALEECDGEECDTPPDWEEYTSPALSKSLTVGQIKVTPKGKFRLTQKRRWERIDDDQPSSSSSMSAVGNFEFPVVDGEFGRGVYFPVVSAPSGGLRLRVRLNLAPEAMISDEEFYQLESDFTEDLDLLLDGKGVRAIARSEDGSVNLLCVRDSDDVIPLGIVAGSGSVPGGQPAFNLVDLQTRADHLVADIEMVDSAAPLEKSASAGNGRSLLKSTSYLDGTDLLPSSGPSVDRSLLRAAIESCKRDLAFGDVRVELVTGSPDFLPAATVAFCLPSDKVINICPHDPQTAIASLCQELADRLQTAVRMGAMPGDVALQVLVTAAKLTPQRWLEMLIKRYTGAILADQAFGTTTGNNPPAQYLNLLMGRGLPYWGNRRAIAECAAEDFRCAHDPDGLPNLVTLEWDLAVPALARMSQQIISNSISQP